MPDSARFRCGCGFRCYSVDQEWYHRSGICRTLRRILSVVAARERVGFRRHDGVSVDGYVLRHLMSEQDPSERREA